MSEISKALAFSVFCICVAFMSHSCMGALSGSGCNRTKEPSHKEAEK